MHSGRLKEKIYVSLSLAVCRIHNAKTLTSCYIPLEISSQSQKTRQHPQKSEQFQG